MEPSAQSIRAEKEKAKKLRGSQWWQSLVGRGVCHYCQKETEKKFLTMDHIVPLSRGGKSTKGNIVPACKTCNSIKRDRTPVDMILSNEL